MTPNLDQERVERAAEAAIAEAVSIDKEVTQSLDEESRRRVTQIIRAAITAYLGDTHVVVPREPTEAMLEAGRNHAVPSTQSISAIYEAMLKAAGSSPAPASGWQDIATAPKDGRRVLLYSDKIDPPVFHAQWRAWKGGPLAGGGEWVDVWNNDPIGTNDGPIRPTIWLAEPTPPATPDGKNE